MIKSTFETPNLTQSNIEKIGELFPSVITETVDDEKSTPKAKVYKKAINFEALKQLLTDEVLIGNEAYEFTWVGKKDSIIEANRPIRKALRPCKEESRDWETTQNLYIEGDNLEVLKLLQESYLGKVKMIYIDPPYNTGNDFVYRDKWAVDSEEWSERIGEYDDETGSRLFRNSESNGRFHSDWCSMIYPRLMLARNLLCDDGVIFISIDDNEVAQLRKICDEVFGEGNFINQVSWVRTRSGKTVTKQLLVNMEYLLIYTKSNSYCWNPVYQPLAESTLKMYSKNDHDGRGKYRLYPMQKTSTPGPETTYDYIDNNGKIWKCPVKGWRMIQSKIKDLENDGRLCLENDTLSEKAYWNDRDSEGKLADTLWDDMPENSVGSKEILKIFNDVGFFDNPKPVDYVKRTLKIPTYNENNDIILDFFSGSATTAHAVMQLNAEDGGNRKFIMVQLPEPCKKDSEAFKAGYKNICEIGKERIRRAGNKIKEDAGLNGQNLDIGFRVFKVDSTNMKDVYYGAGEYEQKDLDGFASNIKDDRTDLDLLYACILDWGLELSYPHKTENIDGFNVHIVNDDLAGATLIACFDTDISKKALTAIAKKKPLRAVFRDSSFASSPAKINVFELFKLHAPDTKVKVI